MSSEQDSATLFQTHLFGARPNISRAHDCSMRPQYVSPLFSNDLLQNSPTSTTIFSNPLLHHAFQHCSATPFYKYIQVSISYTSYIPLTLPPKSISCTCASKEHVAEEDQQPARHWRPFSWRDPNGRIPHLRSRSSYVPLHLLYFKDNSMCFKDFSQIGSLEGR